MAENLSLRQEEIARRLTAAVGKAQAVKEVAAGIERIFSYAAWADKFDGAVHNPPSRTIAIAMNEPIGTVGIICPNEAPLLGLLSLVLPTLGAGNTTVVIPSETYPLIVGDLYQILDTSDLPDGVVNIVTGPASELLKTIAEHDDVDAIWCFSDEPSATAAKAFSVGNLKQVFTNVRCKTSGRPMVSAARHPGEEHLGTLRRIAGPQSTSRPHGHPHGIFH
jgi:aldehyde dehydrogenase (NAD+)